MLTRVQVSQTLAPQVAAGLKKQGVGCREWGKQGWHGRGVEGEDGGRIAVPDGKNCVVIDKRGHRKSG